MMMMNIKQLTFAVVECSVLFEVRTGVLIIVQKNCVFKVLTHKLHSSSVVAELTGLCS
jgi:hypothetical protein